MNPVMTCFNTQPPEGGCGRRADEINDHEFVSTHSRPKAAAYTFEGGGHFFSVSTHSRPKAAAQLQGGLPVRDAVFQHTAARRRLR